MQYKKRVVLLLLPLLPLGCSALDAENSKLFQRPQLQSIQKNKEGGICIDKEDSIALLLYIRFLEEK